MAAALDISALPGGNPDEAISAIGRLMRTGHVDNRVLGGLGFGENDFFAQMTKRTGIGREALKKEMEAGKLDTAQGLEALYDLVTKRTGKDLGGAGVGMSTSLGARLTHLKDLPEQFSQGLSKTEGYEKFSATIGRLLETLDPESATGKRIFANLDKAFLGFADSLAKVDMEKFSKTVVGLFTALPPLIEATTRAIIALSSATAGWLTGPSKIGKSDSQAVPTPGIKMDLFKGMAMQANGMPVPMRPNGKSNWFDRMFGYSDADAARDTKRWEENYGKIGKGAEAGITKGIPGAEKSAAELGDATVKAMAGPSGIDAQSPSKKFEKLGRMSVAGYARGMDDFDFVPPSFSAGALDIAGSRQGGAVSISAPITITVNGSEMGHQEIAELIRIEVPSAILGALEQIGLQGGYA